MLSLFSDTGQFRTLLHYIVSLAQQSAPSILQLPEELSALAAASRLDLASMDNSLNELGMQVRHWICCSLALGANSLILSPVIFVSCEQLNGAATEARRCEEESSSFPRSVLAAIQELQDEFSSQRAQHASVIGSVRSFLP